MGHGMSIMADGCVRITDGKSDLLKFSKESGTSTQHDQKRVEALGHVFKVASVDTEDSTAELRRSHDEQVWLPIGALAQVPATSLED